ncbi:conserved hypothetical protein [delta proteobacterium NaphS2]|nr:conserved hypothetical protein [delta proteobacterium NaphS2]
MNSATMDNPRKKKGGGLFSIVKGIFPKYPKKRKEIRR